MDTQKQYYGTGSESPMTTFVGYAEPGLMYCQ
jgi:hypothetical protein